MIQEHEFVVGVDTVFRLTDGCACIVAGKLQGTIRVGDAVTVWDPGNDAGEVFQSEVLGIETGYCQPAQEATDCIVALTLRDGALHTIRTGSVVAHPSAAEEDVHTAYRLAILDNYVLPKEEESMESPALTDDLVECMSIADVAQAWWAHSWYCTQCAADADEAVQALWSEWSARCLDVLAAKILNAEKIYCIYSKKTGCPYLFSETSRHTDGEYECTMPAIRVYPEAERALAESVINPERHEVRCIERGATGRGIESFLRSAFWQDGACAVQVISGETILSAGQLVPAPGAASEQGAQGEQGVGALADGPVANPQLVRWMLLMGQMDTPTTADEQTVFQLYWTFFCGELPQARLLQPVRVEQPENAIVAGQSDDSGDAFSSEVKISFETFEGKDGRQAAYLYTDWKRFRTMRGEGWEGMVQTVGDVVGWYDCALNVTEFPDEACYVTEQAYRDYCSDTCACE